MTSRNRWFRPSGKRSVEYYATLQDNDARDSKKWLGAGKTKRRVMRPATATSTSNLLSQHCMPTTPTDFSGGMLQHCHYHIDELDAAVSGGRKELPVGWCAFRMLTSQDDEDQSDADVDSEDEDDDDNMLYMANYYGKATFPKKKTNYKNHPQAPTPPRRGRLRFPQMLSPSDLRQKLSLSHSFETQDTQMEESSATSISTTASCDDDDEITLAPTKTIRWLDQVKGGGALATVHSIEHTEAATCRIVILLNMDHGPKSTANNFEFLHCEFRQDDRLRVSEALQQITRLVLGTPEAPLLPQHTASSSGIMPQESFRPFTRLWFEGRELINAFALQDYFLEDGKSTLVAIREGSENDRDALLQQSALLLADKRMRRVIRKARIAGRSLQLLYGTHGLGSSGGKQGGENTSPDGDNDDDDETSDAVDATMNESQEPWLNFDNLSLSSFDYDEFGDVSFETTKSLQSAEWLAGDFFDGKELFSSSYGTNAMPQPLETLTCANNSLEWKKCHEDGALFPDTELSSDGSVDCIPSSKQATESAM